MMVRTEKDRSGRSDEHRMGTLAKIYNVLLSPSKTFQSINQEPTWFVPFLFVLAAVLVFQILVVPVRIKDAKERITNNLNLTPSQVEMGLERIEEFERSPAFRTKIAFGLGLFAGAETAKLFAVALVFMFAVQVGGRNCSFIKVLGVASYVNLVSVIEMGVKLPLIVAKETLNVYTSLAIILPQAYQNRFLLRFLDRFSVFALWKVVLFSIGLAAATQLSSRKSAFLVAYVWIGWLMIYALFGDMVLIR